MAPKEWNMATSVVDPERLSQLSNRYGHNIFDWPFTPGRVNKGNLLLVCSDRACSFH